MFAHGSGCAKENVTTLNRRSRNTTKELLKRHKQRWKFFNKKNADKDTDKDKDKDNDEGRGKKGRGKKGRGTRKEGKKGKREKEKEKEKKKKKKKKKKQKKHDENDARCKNVAASGVEKAVPLIS